MRLTWFGHACFLIETAGLRIITDPYSPECGYDAVEAAADIVTLSHSNARYHSCLDHIQGDPEILHGLQLQSNPTTCRGIDFTTIPVFEDADGEGPNMIFRFTSEALTVAHMGDVGHPLNAEALGALQGVDILLALAGGAPTIALGDLMTAIAHLKPAWVIPMHMGTAKIDLDLLPISALERHFPPSHVHRQESATAELSAEARPDAPTLLILEHAR